MIPSHQSKLGKCDLRYPFRSRLKIFYFHGWYTLKWNFFPNYANNETIFVFFLESDISQNTLEIIHVKNTKTIELIITEIINSTNVNAFLLFLFIFLLIFL